MTKNVILSAVRRVKLKSIRIMALATLDFVLLTVLMGIVIMGLSR